MGFLRDSSLYIVDDGKPSGRNVTLGRSLQCETAKQRVRDDAAPSHCDRSCIQTCQMLYTARKKNE